MAALLGPDCVISPNFNRNACFKDREWLSDDNSKKELSFFALHVHTRREDLVQDLFPFLQKAISSQYEILKTDLTSTRNRLFENLQENLQCYTCRFYFVGSHSKELNQEQRNIIKKVEDLIQSRELRVQTMAAREAGSDTYEGIPWPQELKKKVLWLLELTPAERMCL